MLKQLSRLKHTSRIIVLWIRTLDGSESDFLLCPEEYQQRRNPPEVLPWMAKVGGDEITVAEVTPPQR